jgi:hypothetical protein
MLDTISHYRIVSKIAHGGRALRLPPSSRRSATTARHRIFNTTVPHICLTLADVGLFKWALLLKASIHSPTLSPATVMFHFDGSTVSHYPYYLSDLVQWTATN